MAPDAIGLILHLSWQICIRLFRVRFLQPVNPTEYQNEYLGNVINIY
jgi:hypothetical protein